MTKVMIDDAVYNPVYLPYLTEYTRTQIFYGGSSSGKSVFLAQRCVEDVLKGGRNYLVCRQVARTMKTSVFAQVVRVISEWGVGDLFNINKSDYVITCSNGYQIVFVGLDDVDKIKSITPARGAWTDVWVEEATETDQRSIRQLYKRQRGGSDSVKKRMILSFNPILKTHWIYTEYFKSIGWADSQREYRGEDIAILKTTYKDNRFLTDDDRRDLENESDKYFYDVYTLGNWGILGHVIFTNWRVEDLSGMMDQFTNRRHGLDFGFASDPAALWSSHYDRMRKIIYVFDEVYETGLTNPQLAERIKPIVGGDLVTADSAEPKSISELSGDRVNPILIAPAAKGKDSVNHGIQWLQQHTIIVDRHCVNLQNELSTYHWKEDAGGNALPIPVDKNNHLIDAGRYAHENDMDDGWLAM